MGYCLLIVESPAKCSKIEKFLGKNYKCIASFGHIRELAGLKNIDIKNNFNPTFDLIESKMQQIRKIKLAVKNAEKVMIATDDDREGEAIGWHLCKVAGLPIDKTPRIIFHEITETAIKNAVKNPTTLNMDIIGAQLARQILDVLVGYKLSPILWDKIAKNTKSKLSAGRCQTPALRLVYENQEKYNESPGDKIYKIIGYFTSKCLPFVLNTEFTDSNNVELFLKDTVTHSHILTKKKPKPLIKKPPIPFSTSRLQQVANNELKISPKETMEICQRLYEAGHITYMRTDSTKYSEDFINICSNYIETTYGKQYCSSLLEAITIGKAKKNKNAQEAHEAIRVTKIKNEVALNELTGRNLRLYKLILRNTLESCMANAKYNSMTVSISAPNISTLDKQLYYKYTTELVDFDGWQIVDKKENTEQKLIYNYLCSLKNKSEVSYTSIKASLTLKNLVSHYTEASLVQKLEKKNIGRPSTFSALISKIQEREYVKKTNVPGKEIECIDYELNGTTISQTSKTKTIGAEKNKLVIQPVGILVIEYLIANFDSLFEYSYTASMENSLDLVASGKEKWYNTCDTCLQEITTLINKAGIIEKVHINIDDDHTYIVGKYGPVLKCTQNNKTTFKQVKKNIDLQKLKNNEYTLEDLLETPQENKCLGSYKNKKVYIKNGKYGFYIEHGTVKKSITANTISEITFESAVKTLNEAPSSMIRVLNDEISIRKGKYGDYVFYKKQQWKKPRFLKLNGFIKEYGPNSYKTKDISLILSWLKETYSL